MERIVMHIDVNNAFLSWEAVLLLEKGYGIDIRNIPSIIGGDEKKRAGIVLAKSPVAKKYGIKTAETIYIAKKKCPNLKVYPPHHDKYQEYSKKLFEYIETFTDEIECISVDECFLEYTSIRNKYGDPCKFAETLQKNIFEKFNFTVNIGIANNKVCAKMASDFEKPNKIHTLFNYEIEKKLWNLSVGKLYMVGRSSVEVLENMGINTIGDLAKTSLSKLKPKFKSRAIMMHNYANGIDDSKVEKKEESKCIGNEFTLSEDCDNVKDLLMHLKVLSDKVSRRLKDANLYCRCVTIVLKNNLFITTTKQMQLQNYTNSNKELFEVAKKLLLNVYNNDKIRLVGLRTSKLNDKKNEQISIFEDVSKNIKDEKIDKIIEQINTKYNKNIINYLDDYKS